MELKKKRIAIDTAAEFKTGAVAEVGVDTGRKKPVGIANDDGPFIYTIHPTNPYVDSGSSAVIGMNP